MNCSETRKKNCLVYAYHYQGRQAGKEGSVGREEGGKAGGRRVKPLILCCGTTQGGGRAC